MEAAACGVPMLVSPICNDQLHNARFVERAGVGVRLDLRTAADAAIGAALDALLGDGGVRERGRVVAESYGADGAAEAARRVLALATRGDQPSLRVASVSASSFSGASSS